MFKNSLTKLFSIKKKSDWGKSLNSLGHNVATEYQDTLMTLRKYL